MIALRNIWPKIQQPVLLHLCVLLINGTIKLTTLGATALAQRCYAFLTERQISAHEFA
jgi:hypothetical protein